MEKQSRLQKLLEKQKKLEEDITAEKSKEEANKVLNSIGANVATVVTTAAGKAKIDVKVLHGKFFALSVDDSGKLSIEVVTKANGTKKTTTTTTAGNGNGNFEYFLADGRGGFESIQAAMEALGIPEANRPKHNRYDRLSEDWKTKIERRAKAPTAEAPTAEAPAAEAPTAEAPTAEAPAAEAPES